MATETRTVFMSLALDSCTSCHGLGTLSHHFDSLDTPCNCVFRGIFRVVLRKIRHIEAGWHITPQISLRAFGRGQGERTIGRRNEEFSADVYLVAKRTLTDLKDWDLFRFYHLLGADWKLCSRKLNLSRGNFFHAVYRVEEKLGLVFSTLKPYALYPVDEYFAKITRAVDVRPLPIPAERYPNGIPLRPPLAIPHARPAPALAPAPTMPPMELMDTDSFVRSEFIRGLTLRSIGESLQRRGYAPPNGVCWTGLDDKRILLNHSVARTPLPKAA